MTDDLEGPTERIAEPAAARRPPLVTSALTAIAGVLVCVLVILAVGMVGAQIVAGQHGQPGPGAGTLGVHLAAAVVGIAGYRLASRRPGALPPVVCAALLVIAGLVLWFYWWAA
jgi:hypothetical protein